MISVCTVKPRLLWIWQISILVFCGVALTATQSVLPNLDPVVLDGQLRPVAQSLRQETCDNCGETVIAFGINEPSLNVYSRLSEIKRPQTLEDLADQLQTHANHPVLLVVRNSVLSDQLSTLSSATSEQSPFDNLPDLTSYERLYQSQTFTIYKMQRR